MPIVINEIEVSVEVVNGSSSSETAATNMPAEVRDEIIRACVEQIMEILKQKNER